MLTDELKRQIQHFYSAVASATPGFKRRVGQREMIAAVARALSCPRPESEETTGKNVAVVEGRTGVGKTVGYMIPALVLAKAASKKLIVSTATVALQEQLVKRDLPNLLKSYGTAATVALAKGRRRFVCVSRLYELAGHGSQDKLFEDETESWDRKPEHGELDQLVRLSERLHAGKWSGDLDLLEESLPAELARRVTTDSTGCSNRRCPAFKECPYFRHRSEVAAADVIVANHDLVLACLGSDSPLLPPPPESFYVFDEAHHLPGKALEHYAFHSSIGALAKACDRLPTAIGKYASLLAEPYPTGRLAELARSSAHRLSELLVALRDSEFKGAGHTLRFEHGKLPDAFLSLTRDLVAGLNEIRDLLDLFDTSLSESLEDGSIDATRGEMAIRETAPRIAHVTDGVQAWRRFCEPADPDCPEARWIQYHPDSRDLSIHGGRLLADTILREQLWSPSAGIVLTSATLRTLGNFSHFLRKSGLTALPHVEPAAVSSPFDYPSQGELHVPRMASDPKDAEAHTAEIIQMMPGLLAPFSYGQLVLFASRRQMEAVSSALPEHVKADVLVQGDLPRGEMLRTHAARITSGQRSILFGLASLGEGLDLPGHQCEHVVIAKLPFAPPDSPIEEALAEWVESRGGNSFAEIALPNTGLILCQWVGRLIRTETDLGRVTILDKRITSKSYGRRLIAGLPEFRRV